MIELRPTDMAHGGEAVARSDGKTHFVDGAIPGELVQGRVIRDAGNWARVELVGLVEASPDRIAPPCRHFGACGGCQWQFAEHRAQLEWKQRILTGQLAHLGRIADPPVRPTLTVGPAYGYRNRVDFDVAAGRPAFHRRRSRDLEPIVECLLLEPPLADLVPRLGSLDGVKRLTLRTNSAGETLAVVVGRAPDGIADWGCGVVQRRGAVVRSLLGSGYLFETIAGVAFRVSADAFFQNNTAGAAALVDLVGDALTPTTEETMLDGYAGGGLFGLTVGRGAGRVVAVESEPLALDDLAQNSATSGGRHRIVAAPFERADIGGRWDVAVVDPPRTGLGADGVATVIRGRPRAIAYVSCDPASLARDTALLVAAGYRLEWVTPVDLFPQTFHIEAVAKFSPV
ncbi:MAG TPA: class I SAM-dependent RNA methyltransferase [Acidimicrobiia bacterium]|nr:class I SAM-dependent RNA methyltransferase [Acidimicrobiia bacterium]